MLEDTTTLMRPQDAMVDAEAPTDLDDLEQRVAFEAIRGKLFGELGQPVSIGRFVVTNRLGQGGMGVVYAAYDPQLDRKVAVKVLRDLGDEAHAEKARRSLEREARAAAGLSHPNVVTVYDSGTVADGFYVAMELVEGSTLRSWLETPRRWPELVRMFVAAGQGLQAAHEAGLVHCDFKPDNVLVGADGRPRVLDFGLVRWVGQTNASGASTGPTASPARVGSGRGHGTVIGGTLAYMPPEQFEGQAEARSDQYSFCVALYRALFDEHPYGASHRLGRAHERTWVPRRVVRAILKGLAPEVGERHASMRVLIDELQRALRWRSRLPWALAGVMVVGSVAGATYASARVEPCEEAALEIQAVWTDETRDAVTASLAAAGDPGQAEALARRLDDYAQAWGAMRRESCEATHVEGVQSGELLELRTACLGRQRNTLEHTLVRLGALSTAQGEEGRQLVERLPDLAACTADALRSHVLVRRMDQSRTERSEDPEAFAEIQVLLDRARSEGLLGERRAALSLAAEAEPRAREAGLRNLEADALELRVSLEVKEGRVSGAEPELQRALQLAVDSDEHQVAANTVIRLLSLERLGGAALADRPLLAGLGRAWAGRTNRASTLRAEIDFEQASHAQSRGDPLAALGLIEAALAALANDGLADDTIALKLRTIEGSNLLDLGRFEEAERELAALLAIQRVRLPIGHIDLGDTTFYLANALLALGRAEEALALAEEASTIYRERLGASHTFTLTARHVLARAWRQHGDLRRAAMELVAVLDAIVGTHGPFHANGLFVLLDLAELEHEAGELVRASSHAMIAMITASRSYRAESVETSVVAITLGKILIDLGELEPARTLLTRAHHRVDGTLDPLAPAAVAYQLSRLARRSTPPDLAGARAFHDEALALLRDLTGDDATRLRRQIVELGRRPVAVAQAQSERRGRGPP